MLTNYKESTRKKILDFTTEKVNDFLGAHPSEIFYAFAFDCNAEYGEINLCFNTEESFEKTLKEYQSGPYAESYKKKEDIIDLKYNTGDWAYQCFNTIYCATEEELSSIFGADIDLQIKEIMGICWAALTEFQKTSVYVRIPQTKNFISYCIDHDESPLDVIKSKGLLGRVNTK